MMIGFDSHFVHNYIKMKWWTKRGENNTVKHVGHKNNSIYEIRRGKNVWTIFFKNKKKPIFKKDRLIGI